MRDFTCLLAALCLFAGMEVLDCKRSHTAALPNLVKFALAMAILVGVKRLSWLGIGLGSLWLSTFGIGVLLASFHKSDTARRLQRVYCSSWSKIHIDICAASWFSSSLS
jgi:hypothetical protein